MTPIMKARPPKAYNCKANIPVGEMLSMLLPLKATDGVGDEAEDCWLMNIV